MTSLSIEIDGTATGVAAGTTVLEAVRAASGLAITAAWFGLDAEPVAEQASRAPAIASAS